MARRIGCCSWSLRAQSPRQLAQRVRSVGVDSVQLALGPLREGAFDPIETAAVLADAGVAIRSGMMATIGEDYSTLERIRSTGGVRVDALWSANLVNARADAAIAARLGIPLVTFHAGFLPEDRADAERARLLERLRALCDVFGAHGIALGFETGQETADTLLELLADLDCANAGVNFDPANMILYDMGDPVAALERLAPHVRQIHIKDATRTRVAGAWGEEVQVGRGEVDWRAFFGVLAAHRIEVDLMIEREAGDDRVGDMQQALTVIGRELGEVVG